jgi:hypothetical protein
VFSQAWRAKSESKQKLEKLQQARYENKALIKIVREEQVFRRHLMN